MKKSQITIFFLFIMLFSTRVLFSQTERKEVKPNVAPRVLNIDALDPVKYTSKAIRKEIEGEVAVEITVDAKGNYVSHELINADHEWLADAVEPYLKELKFSPGQVNGEATESKKQIRVIFEILKKFPPKTEITVDY